MQEQTSIKPTPEQEKPLDYIFKKTKMKKVTNLLMSIGKCRDIIKRKDKKEILKNIYLFEMLHKNIKIQVDKKRINYNYELDFNFYDLQELSDEIFNYVKNLQSKFIFKNSIKELLKNKVINNETYLKYLNHQCDLMYIDGKLRDAYKIIGYLSVVLWTLEEGHKQYDFSEDISLFIKEFI